MRRHRSLRRSLIALGAGTALALGATACTGSGSGTPSAFAASHPARTASSTARAASSTARSAPPATGSSPAPTVQPASSAARPTSSLPVTDPAPLHTVPTSAVRTLHPVPLSSPAAFGTGVSARVTAVTHGTDRDRGPGAATGRPTVLFHLRLTNGSAKAVSVADVQVLATYGSSRTPAIAATSSTRAFAGTLRPGSSTDAVYAFAVPTAGQGEVAVTVTYTAGRPTVLLTGSAR